LTAVSLSRTEVEALAPDAAVAAAARKLAHARAWKSLGQSERAVWGECQGSVLYRTRACGPELAAKCTCPSRKFPCKHALALLFFQVDSPASFEPVLAGAEPEWVASWLAKHDESKQRTRARAQRTDQKPVDQEARAKRAGKRQANVLAGVEQLDVWMADLVRNGLGRLPAEGPELWDTQARRLIDAQAPGLANRVRAIGHRVGVGENWMERVLGDLGRLALLTEAYRRLDTLPIPLQHDVRRWLGFTLDKEEVLRSGEAVEDEWVIASTTIVEDERLRLRRAWLVGTASQRSALILDVASGSAPFQHTLLAGSALRARLAFWPSARPERALIAERLSEPARGHVPPHARSIAEALDEYATGLARDPWLERTLFVLDRVVIAPRDATAWYAVDAFGQSLRLRGHQHDVLYALSGGHPLCLAGEWNGFVLEPLAAYSDGRAVALKTEAA